MKRRKKTTAARIRPFWMLIALAVILISAGGIALVTWPGFSPREVTVSGNHVVPQPEIVARAGVLPHVNMWIQNTHAIASRVEGIPYIATASVHRIPPATVQIAVTERTPFALLQSGPSAALVDRALRVLSPAPAGTAMALPRFVAGPGIPLVAGAFLTDPGAVELRDDYVAMVDAHVIPLELRFDRYGGLIAIVRGGVEIMLGDGDMEKKLPLVDPILAQIGAKQRRIAAVDLRAPGTPVLLYR